MEESNPDLETFRQQWRAEVLGKNNVQEGAGNSKKLSRNAQRKQRSRKLAFDDLPPHRVDDLEEHHIPQNVRRLTSNHKVDHEQGDISKIPVYDEPKSALEHYEKAVEREAQGSLGDSLDLYRKAFKVRNHRVV